MILIGMALPTSVSAQYPFGKNKISYKSRDWQVLQTDHVDIYYYPSEYGLVAFAAPIVEETFLEFAELFNVEFRDRLPLVFYSSHYDFQQTNIIPSLISEYTGGFTDLIKGRIAIPFTGSLWDFKHVIRHEMVHAFMLEKLATVMSEQSRFTYMHPPLWFIEGMAEYFASPNADTRSHMFVRDGLIHGTLPDLANIWRISGSFLMYKTGEAVVRYIATNYGKESIILILENWWRADQFTYVLQGTIGMSLDELSDAFMKSAKRRYYPAILHNQFTPDIGDQITPPRSFHSRPTMGVTSDGETVLYATSAHDGLVSLVRIREDERGRYREMLVEGGRSSAFESIPAFRSKIEARGDTLLFVSKRQERDALYLWDTKTGRQIEYFTFSSLSVISSPTFSPGGDKIAFSAIDTTGMMDLFEYDILADDLTRLTNDTFSEEDPDYHPSRNLIAFSSNRCETGGREREGLYIIDVDDGTVEALTCGPQSDAHPDWSPDGDALLFTSDRDGTFNIYHYDFQKHTITQQTNVLGGVTTPVYVPDGDRFIASGYYKGEFHLFDFPVKTGGANQAVIIAMTDTTSTEKNAPPDKQYNFTTQEYKQKLGLDFAGAGLAIDPDYGSVGNGGQIVLSDILGNHQYYFFFGNTSQTGGRFLDRLNVGLNYVNLSNRLNYSLGVFRLTSYSGDFFTVFRSERRLGVSTGLSYPFSKFSRLDGSFVLRFIERQSDFADLGHTASFVASGFLTYVVDNTVWTIGGPLKGWRYYATVGQTLDFRNRGFENTTMHFDIRKYFKITKRIVLAERFITRQSWGGDFQIFYLGGPWDLRGYNFREFFGRATYLINNEIRFPLIDRLAMSFPFGTLETPRIRGSVFLDAGQANRFLIDTGWIGSFGAGAELNLGFAPVIRVNFTRTTNFSNISGDTEMELFIGYNY